MKPTDALVGPVSSAAPGAYWNNMAAPVMTVADQSTIQVTVKTFDEHVIAERRVRDGHVVFMPMVFMPMDPALKPMS